ncbi:MAG: excalibur calcium-binding domain-containing protein [Dongiaceae bacterium]
MFKYRHSINDGENIIKIMVNSFEERNRERKLQKLQRRFRAIHSHHDRKIKFSRFIRESKDIIIICLAGFIVLLVILKVSPWPPLVTLKHFAASPNCTSARALNLAPSRRGEPGYYSWHDADDDGIACEPWHKQR